MAVGLIFLHRTYCKLTHFLSALVFFVPVILCSIEILAPLFCIGFFCSIILHSGTFTYFMINFLPSITRLIHFYNCFFVIIELVSNKGSSEKYIGTYNFCAALQICHFYKKIQYIGVFNLSEEV